MLRFRVCVLIAAFWGGAAADALAQEPETAWTAASVAAAIDASASATSFAKLETFGQDSLRYPTPERLHRLDHVAWLFVNQSDFQRFDFWNHLLAEQAALAHDHRFQMVAELNAIRSRYDQGDSGGTARLQAIAEHDTDWYARVHAMSIQAYVLMRETNTGAALQRLAEAESLVPDRDPMSSTARSRIWESEGLALMALHDLKASAVAFGRTEFDYGVSGYPRPDFDDIYNMAKLAAQLGDQDLAARLAATHHRLAKRAGIPGLLIWDRNLCAVVAQHDSPQAVRSCLDGLDMTLHGSAHFLAPQLLPLKVIAEAQSGQVSEAAHDLHLLQALRDTHTFGAAQFETLPRAEAAVLHAQGRDSEAYEQLKTFQKADTLYAAQQFSAGIAQVTQEMQRELGARKDQLATSRRNESLQRDVITAQTLMVVVGGLVVLSVMGLLVWQWRVAKQLRIARKAAEAANRAKSDFLANMSHEIRTPLNGVVAVADMLGRADLDPKSMEMVQIIRASGDTLLRLLSDILDVARIESGKITLETAPFHLGDMVRAVAGLSELKCSEKGISLALEIAPDVDQMVVGDLVRVRQIVTNLLSNAVKFTEKGEVRLTLDRLPSGLTRIIVSDTGVGFAMADKSKVLGRFEQADSSITRRFGGTGLGLSICSDLAKLMGGELDCVGEPGCGSRFWLQLPLEPAPAAHIELKADAALQNDALKVLLADDHPTNRKVVELMLEGGMAALTSVDDGAKALERFKTELFDLVLMDMQMPVMDGLTAVREIRAFERLSGRRSTPVIMLTANALPEHVSAAAAAGADLHLAKPFTVTDLYDTINTALSGVSEAAVETPEAELVG